MFINTIENNASKAVFWTVLITLVIKILFSWFIPVTGDEAYYAIWGIFPAGGGYDHTPFIGWLLYPFLLISKNPIILRLPMVLTTTIIGLGIYYYLKPEQQSKAALSSMLFLISPLSLCAVLITTDAPVILFSFLSGICVLQALKKNDHSGWFFAGGIFLGLAFFSKYFAVLLALSYFIYFVFISPNRARLTGLVIMFFTVLPFGLENLWWNYHHAWANILFNVYNRNTQDHFNIYTVFAYIITLFYIFTPVLFYYSCKHYKKLFQKNALNCFIIIPLIFFLILSIKKEIGLHWPLAFITFVYLWAGIHLNLTELKKAFVFLLYFTGAHVILIILILTMPISFFQKMPLSEKFYIKLVYFFEHAKITRFLQPYQLNYICTSLNYVQADLMFYDAGQYCPTFGKGDVHGRQDDLMTDFSQYAHKNFLIFYSRPPRLSEYLPYFKHTEIKLLTLDHANFYYILGQDFNYPVYRDTVLKYINQTYWQIPPYLPHAPSFFEEKYFKNK